VRFLLDHVIGFESFNQSAGEKLAYLDDISLICPPDTVDVVEEAA
jgi:hypothetical protein